MHVSAREAALTALLRIEEEGAYSDRVLAQLSPQQLPEERERAFVSELVRGVVRRQKYLDWLIDRLYRGDTRKIPADVRILLRTAFYQLIFLKTPPFAAVNECVELIKKRRRFEWSGTANAILRHYLRSPDVPLPPVDSPVEHLAVKYSHPEWLVERWLKQFGREATEALCLADNQTPPLSVRINPLMNSIEEFCRLLQTEGATFERSRVSGFVRILSIDENLRRRLLAEGRMTVQDESAGLVGLLALPVSAEVIADLCAAPGGKATHLAELVPQTLVIAGDRHPRRAALIVDAQKRLQLNNLAVITADAARFPLRRADMVLLDAPCSGLGVLRRKPDIRWRRRPEDIEQLTELQRSLILRAAALTAPGGCLIYSTCTLEREENEEIIEFLLKREPFSIERPDGQHIPEDMVTEDGMVRTFPHLHDMDGAFAVKLKRR